VASPSWHAIPESCVRSIRTACASSEGVLWPVVWLVTLPLRLIGI